ncbi:MAG TPA: peptidylprolyl isomerase [Planctomycetota bacterium]|jgi:parvulin-like peptidyl-prolyl isomerase|nr:peptidylprolyl isomerase [Planctomycetota bacterium]
MKLHAAVAILAALALGCGGGAESKPESQAETKAEVRPKRSGPEPEHILVAHVLVAFQGTGTKATRTQAAAEKLAADVLAKARKGDDFNKLMRDFSDDQGDGVYGLANHKVNPVGDEHERRRMVTGFGDVGFQLEVGDVGMAVYDPVKSKYGWHIIKRLK